MEHVILGFLTMGDMTGYDIKRLMSISTSFFYDASYGSIYPALRKLEERGLVKSIEAIESGRLRKVYSITDEGREEFLRWLGGPPGESKFKYDFLMRMFFFAHLPKEKIETAVTQHLSEIRAVSQKLEMIEFVVRGKADIYQMYTLRFGRDFFAFLQSWFERFLDELKNGNSGKPGVRKEDTL